MISLFAPRARSLGAVSLGAALVLAQGCAPRVTTDQETRIGDDLAAEINRELDIVDDAAVNAYINQLGRSLASNADTRGIRYTFYVVNTREANAFAVPGGHVYVYRGLVERTQNMSELAGVLGHEVAHVAERHAIEQWRRVEGARAGLAAIFGIILRTPPSDIAAVAIDLGAAGVFAGYSREDEREADEKAVGHLVATGIHPLGSVTYLENLLAEREREPGELEQFFATHPTTRERIDNIRAVINAVPASRLQGLTTDTPEYRRFRDQVRQLRAPRE